MIIHVPTKISNQRGAALIVGLIMLLLLTLLGVAGMRDTLLQERMAGNMRDREMALQAAEAALRAGELELQAVSEPTFNNQNGRYDLATTTGQTITKRVDASNKPISETGFWAAWNWTSNSVLYSKQLEGISKSPAYVIEKLEPGMSQRSEYNKVTVSTTRVLAVDLESGDFANVSDAPDYRITARGTGSTEDAVVIVQSTYRRQ